MTTEQEARDALRETILAALEADARGEFDRVIVKIQSGVPLGDRDLKICLFSLLTMKGITACPEILCREQYGANQ